MLRALKKSTYFNEALSTKLRPTDQTISSMGYQINQVVWTFLKKESFETVRKVSPAWFLPSSSCFLYSPIGPCWKAGESSVKAPLVLTLTANEQVKSSQKGSVCKSCLLTFRINWICRKLGIGNPLHEHCDCEKP